ncbi:MAG: hypothetical protein ABIZ49_03850 [Opitutaceae bacterium]
MPKSLLQSVRVDRSAFSVTTLKRADAEDRRYWHSRSPAERLRAVELQRQIAYGYDPATARLQRVLEIVKPAAR